MRTVRCLTLMVALAISAPVVVPTSDLAAQSRQEMSDGAWPEADPADVESIDAIIAALYDVISGPIGEKRDWDRFRSLFVPDARLIPTGQGQGDGPVYQMLTPDEYETTAAAFLEERGFFETETARTLEMFGHVAHAFSTYDSRWKEDDPEPFDRGINSIQLMHDGERWAIMNIFWAAESAGLTIPERYKTSRRPDR